VLGAGARFNTQAVNRENPAARGMSDCLSMPGSILLIT